MDVNGTKCMNLFTTISLPSEVIVSTCLSGDSDLRSPTFGLKTDYIIYKDLWVERKKQSSSVRRTNEEYITPPRHNDSRKRDIV